MTTDSDWALFVDWCTAHELAPFPAAVSTLRYFLRRVPATPAVQHRRVRAIRLRHERLGGTAPRVFPAYTPPPAWRVEEPAVTLPVALAQLPKYRYPAGLRGRRDAFLVVLVGQLRLSRAEAVALQPEAITTGYSVSVSGRRVDAGRAADACPSCAVTRWLRIVGDVNTGSRRVVWDVLTPPGVEPETHDCEQPIDASWRSAAVLLPSIDQYGWAASTPLTTRSVSRIVAAAQMPAEFPIRWPGRDRPELTGRFQNASHQELAAAYDDVDARLTALLTLSDTLLDDATTVLDWIRQDEQLS